MIKITTVSLNKICPSLGVQISSAMGKGVSLAPFMRRDNTNHVQWTLRITESLLHRPLSVVWGVSFIGEF